MTNASRLLMLLAVLLCALPLAAQGNPTAAAKNAAARTYFTDVILVNEDGKEMRFYRDLIEGKVVIMIPFFTTCTGICPPMNRNLEKIQGWLGDRLGRDVNMLSVSVDPLTDTVPRLKEYSQRFHARPGWHFLGGEKENVDFALKKIGQYVEAKEDHDSIMIIGNMRTGLWKKARALGRIEELIAIVESVVNDKGEVSPNSAGARPTGRIR